MSSDTRPGTRNTVWRRRWAGPLLVAGAALALVVPVPHQTLVSVGTADGETVDSAGYANRYTLLSQTPEKVAKGDNAISAVNSLFDTAATNKRVADRRLLCLALGLPGAYLLGRRREDEGP